MLQLFVTLMAGGEPGGSPMSFVFMGALLIVFYFFMIRPQMRKSKEQKKFREEIGKGDKIVTIGGVHGKITEVEDTTFIIELFDKTRVRIEKAAISMESTMAVADTGKGGKNTKTKSDEKAKEQEGKDEEKKAQA